MKQRHRRNSMYHIMHMPTEWLDFRQLNSKYLAVYGCLKIRFNMHHHDSQKTSKKGCLGGKNTSVPTSVSLYHIKMTC